MKTGIKAEKLIEDIRGELGQLEQAANQLTRVPNKANIDRLTCSLERVRKYLLRCFGMMKIARLLKQVGDDGFIICPECGNHLGLDTDECSCGWKNLLLALGYV